MIWIYRQGEGFTLLECAVGRNGLRGGWQPWGLKGFGGQALKTSEKSVYCKPWTDSITISPGKLRLLSTPGRREQFRTAKSWCHLLGQSLKKEKPVWTQLAHLDARKENRRRTFVEEGGEVPLALRNSGGVFLPTHLSEHQWTPATAQMKGADNWAINLWWEVWNSN